MLQAKQINQDGLNKQRKSRKRNHEIASLQCNEVVFGCSKTKIKQETSPVNMFYEAQVGTPKQHKRIKRGIISSVEKDIFES